MSQRRILIVLSTSRYSQHLVDQALEEARAFEKQGEQVWLEVLYIIESEELNKVSQKVGDSGFLGMSVQKEVLEALGSEHHRMAMLRIQEVCQMASAHGYELRITEKKGSFAHSIITYAQDHPFDVILLTRADRPFISRFLFGSQADKVARLARKEGIKVIIDEQ